MATKFNQDSCDVGEPPASTKLPAIRETGKIEYFQRRFFDLVSGKPLQFDEVEKRLINTLGKIEKLSIEAILDLYFIHRNWQGFYNRQNNFRKWVNEFLNISLSYTYDIIKAVDLLLYYESEALVTESLPELLVGPIETIGIKKLKLIAQVKDESIKRGLLKDMLDGKDYTPEFILAKNRKAEVVQVQKATEEEVEEEDQIEIEESPIQTIFDGRTLKLVRGNDTLELFTISERICMDHHMVDFIQKAVLDYAIKTKMI